jgi:ABC-type sugar transport system substrate-binding protein
VERGRLNAVFGEAAAEAVLAAGGEGEPAVAEEGEVLQPAIKEVVARIPTEWNQEKALAGLTNALQANPDVGLVFTSSDFLFPSVVSALTKAGRYQKAGEDGHVLLGGFDGDATAYQRAEVRVGAEDAGAGDALVPVAAVEPLDRVGHRRRRVAAEVG